jgi:esterase/lipase
LKLRVPVLTARGEYDGTAREEDLLNFFKHLPLKDPQSNFLPGASHSATLGENREQIVHLMRAFLKMPSRQDTLRESE